MAELGWACSTRLLQQVPYLAPGPGEFPTRSAHLYRSERYPVGVKISFFFQKKSWSKIKGLSSRFNGNRQHTELWDRSDQAKEILKGQPLNWTMSCGPKSQNCRKTFSAHLPSLLIRSYFSEGSNFHKNVQINDRQIGFLKFRLFLTGQKKVQCEHDFWANRDVDRTPSQDC